MKPEPACHEPRKEPVLTRDLAPPLPAMKLSLFHTFAFLPAWFRPVDPDAQPPPPSSGSVNETGTVPPPVWAEAHQVRFPLYLSNSSRSRGRGQRGDHPW